MKAGRGVIWAVLALGVVGAGMGWIRLAPQDVARWHAVPQDITPRDLTGGAVRAVAGDAATFSRLDAVIRATPRTRVLAGSVAEGMVTYVTRSAVFGFPDYTTVRLRGGQVQLYGRSRFGVSDLGVNAARLDGWLRALHAG